jgi:hypothetical protein
MRRLSRQEEWNFDVSFMAMQAGKIVDDGTG